MKNGEGQFSYKFWTQDGTDVTADWNSKGSPEAIPLHYHSRSGKNGRMLNISNERGHDLTKL